MNYKASICVLWNTGSFFFFFTNNSLSGYLNSGNVYHRTVSFYIIFLTYSLTIVIALSLQYTTQSVQQPQLWLVSVWSVIMWVFRLSQWHDWIIRAIILRQYGDLTFKDWNVLLRWDHHTFLKGRHLSASNIVPHPRRMETWIISILFLHQMCPADIYRYTNSVS